MNQLARGTPAGSAIPAEVEDVLKTTKIGYLSVISGKGELYSYPVAFHYADARVYFMTPESAAKFRFIKSNPVVSLIVDNKKLTTDACGAMIQGRARTFTVARTMMSILSLGPKMVGFAQKYPGMFTFYARGKELPDERKLYKYRLIRIDPFRIVYWQGYKFGRFVVSEKKKKKKTKTTTKADAVPGLDKGENGAAVFTELLQSADEDIPLEKFQVDHDWIARLDEAASQGILSDEERSLLRSLKGEASAARGPGVSEDEKKLLKKLRDSR